jgi:hypothetical protein
VVKAIELTDSCRINFKRIKGHVYIELPITREGGSNDDTISFVYDSGAVITVLSRDTYERYAFNKLPRFNAVIPGYAGDAPGWVYKIPGITVGKRLLTGVYAFSPEDYMLGLNLLADNVMEYFNIYQDNCNDCLYFFDNPKPEPLTYASKNAVGKESTFSLACDGIYAHTADVLMTKNNSLS